MRVCLLASGSRGNALFIETGETRLLVDAGLSARQLAARLAPLAVEARELHGLLVTHEHRDHVAGLGPVTRSFALPAFIHPATRESLPPTGPLPLIHSFETGRAFRFRDLEITAFSTTHDAACPVGFVIDGPEGRIAIATDLGRVTRLVRDQLAGSRVLVLESNHDEEMLMNGPYPWPLKQRVRSAHGHLSNADSSDLLAELLWEGLEVVFLAHLSETNNHPDLARDAALRVLENQTRCRPALIVGSQDCASPCALL